MNVEVIDGTRVVITREFAATPERLYRAFTDPDDAAAWMWGRNAGNPTAEMDVRIGGRYRVAIKFVQEMVTWPSTAWDWPEAASEIRLAASPIARRPHACTP